MNSTQRKNFYLSILLVALVSTAAGCGGGSKIKAKAWNISLTKKTSASIQVDLVGVTEIEKPSWEAYPLSKYWMPEDSRRLHADKLSMSLEMDKPWVVDRNDPKWREWLGRGVTSLLIITRLPGSPQSFEPGVADPRRIAITLDKNHWQGKTLKFEVLDTELRMLTPPK